MKASHLLTYLKELDQHFEDLWQAVVNDRKDAYGHVFFFQASRLNTLVLWEIESIVNADHPFESYEDKLRAIEYCLDLQGQYYEKAHAWFRDYEVPW